MVAGGGCLYTFLVKNLCVSYLPNLLYIFKQILQINLCKLEKQVKESFVQYLCVFVAYVQH